jgi:tetratricopeptide (TPR) repeat protein
LTGEELKFIDGCRAVVQGSDHEALLHLRKASSLADGAFLAGLVALKMDRSEEAAEYLSSIIDRERELDRYISTAGIAVTVRLPITEEVSTMVIQDMRGVLLALAQAYMKEMRWRNALVQLERLLRLDPHDIAARLAMVEWLLNARPGESESCQEIIRLTEGEGCDSILEGALLLDRARALKVLGRFREARNALDKVLCSAKVRHPELLDAACSERSSLEEGMHQGGHRDGLSW